MTISIIIPTYNRKDLLRKLLTMIRDDRVSHAAATLEVIVADDLSSDGTEEMVRAEFPFARLVQGPGKNSPLNKRSAIEVASGDYIVNLDDDALPRPGWIAATVPVLERGEKVVQSKIIFFDLGQRELRDESKPYFFSGFRWDMMPILANNGGYREQYVGLCHEFGVFVSREVLAKHPFDDPNLLGDLGESASFALRIQKSGYKILFNPKCVIEHLGVQQGGTYDRGRKSPKRECNEYSTKIIHNYVLFARLEAPLRLIVLIPYYFFGSFYLAIKQRRQCYKYVLPGVWKALTRKIVPVNPYTWMRMSVRADDRR